MKKVLIVDDTLTTRDDTNAVIQGLGYDTVMASSAKEGLAFLNNNCVDLFLVIVCRRRKNDKKSIGYR